MTIYIMSETGFYNWRGRIAADAFNFDLFMAFFDDCFWTVPTRDLDEPFLDEFVASEIFDEPDFCGNEEGESSDEWLARQFK